MHYLFTKCFVIFNVIVTCMSSRSNPEAKMPVPEIIVYHGYPAETHYVTTGDGYILELHRIPHGKNGSKNEDRPVIFLQHGLLCSSADWVVNPPKGSLGFLLSDAGFDVWLGNSRGNTYSNTHKKYSIKSDEYWKFSWDEMAAKDMPAVVDYIISITKKEQIYYVGHSQGTMIAFAGFSRNHQMASKIKRFYGLAPVAYLGNMKTPLKYLANFLPELKFLFKIFGVRDFMPQSWLITWLASHMCTTPVLKNVCSNIVFAICGYDKPQMNQTRLDVYMTHAPSGTSVQNIVHYDQAFKSSKFQMFDFGEKENMVKYNQSDAPLYDLSKFNIPSVLYSGGNDWLADPSDVKALLAGLPKDVVEFHYEIKSWMHLDFIWGMDAPNEVYYHLIQDALKDVNRL